MTDLRAPEICLVYPRSRVCGGAQAVLAWAVHALQDQWRVHVFTLDQCDPTPWSATYGTRVCPEKVRWTSLESEHPFLTGFLRRWDLVTLDQYVLMKWFAHHYPSGAVPFSCHNEMAFPMPGLQYVHFPMLMTGEPPLSRVIGQSGSWSKECFGKGLKHMCRITNEGLRRNVSLCNSAFIENIFRQYYGKGAATAVVHPPVLPPEVRPEVEPKRQDGVIMIGRLVPHKRVEDGIHVVRACRETGIPLNLHLVTSGGSPAYVEKIKALSEREPWIHWHWRLTREELVELCSRMRFGLHCNQNEHFGIVTAEMVHAGCIVLGHDSGGTREILPMSDQRFSTPEEGARKLAEIHDSPELQSLILTEQERTAKQFSTERFCELVREHARQALLRISPSEEKIPSQ